MAIKLSIMQDLNRDWIPCFVCGRPASDLHHCLHGTANRKICDRYKLTVALCRNCHSMVHDKGMYDNVLKEKAQMAFEKEYGSREEFIELFGKNYL